MERFCDATSFGSDVEEWWLGPAWDLKDAPSYYLPEIKGTMTVGATLTAAARTSDLRWTLVTYQWLRDGLPIAGENTSTYELTEADIGKTIALATRGRADFHQDAAEIITADMPVRGYALSVGAPEVRRNGRTVGSVLSVDPGTWTTGTSFSYRWLRNGAGITGATARVYKIREADRGQRITVRVTGTKPLFAPVTKTVLGIGSVIL